MWSKRATRKASLARALGAPAKSGRIAYGALLIKERLGITDEETLEQVMENPYLQYFLGLSELQEKPLFNPSMMVHFRSRFSAEHHQLINSKIIEAAAGTKSAAEGNVEDDSDDAPSSNRGKLLVDASCVPADIRYPTDLGLLNEARQKSEALIDQFHRWMRQASGQPVKKPRTYRQEARKRYLAVAKQKKPGVKVSISHQSEGYVTWTHSAGTLTTKVRIYPDRLGLQKALRLLSSERPCRHHLP
jgi:hypothetical protein